MAELHDRFNELHAAGASKEDLRGFLEANVPAEQHKGFQATARKQRSRAARAATETGEQAAARRAASNAERVEQRNRASGKAADIDEAHDTISGELSRAVNPVKVEFRPTQDTVTSQMLPPGEVPAFAAAHPGNDLSFTFTDHGGEARQYHTTRGSSRDTVREGHATGGRVLVGSRPEEALAKREAQGLPTTSSETFQTAGFGHAPFGVTPDLADRFKQTQAIRKSQQILDTARALPDPRPLPITSEAGEEIRGMRSRVAGVGGVHTEAARETHEAMMKFDPEYADAVDKAAGEHVTKQDAVQSAEARMLETRRNAGLRGIRTDTMGGVRPTSNFGESTADVLENSKGGGFRFNESRTVIKPNEQAVQDYVYSRQATPQDRSLRLAYHLAAGAQAGGPRALAHLRAAERFEGINWSEPSTEATPPPPTDAPQQQVGSTPMENMRRRMIVRRGGLQTATGDDRAFMLSSLAGASERIRNAVTVTQKGEQIGEETLRYGEKSKKAGQVVTVASGPNAGKAVKRPVYAEDTEVPLHTTERAKEAAALGQMYWQMGTHPMYKGMRDEPEQLIEQTKALGGRATGTTMGEQATALQARMDEVEHEHRMTDTPGYTPQDWRKRNAPPKQEQPETPEPEATPEQKAAQSKERRKASSASTTHWSAEDIEASDFGRMQSEIETRQAGEQAAPQTLRERHNELRNMVRADLHAAIQSSAAQKGLLSSRAHAAGQVQIANGPAEDAIDGAKAATSSRSQRSSVPQALPRTDAEHI